MTTARQTAKTPSPCATKPRTDAAPDVHVPADLAARTDLPGGAKLLLAIMHQVARQGDLCQTKERTMAKWIGTSVRNVRRHLRRLEAEGLVVPEIAAGGRGGRAWRVRTEDWTDADPPTGPVGDDDSPDEGERSGGLTVAQLVEPYLKDARDCYNNDNTFIHIRSACKCFLALHANTRIEEFGPLALKEVRKRLVERGLARKTVNRRVCQIKGIFRWGAENEMIPADLWHRLRVVKGLKRGRGGRETAKVRPVAWEDVEAVRPHVSAQVWAMIQLQWHTGMRPGEVIQMRTTDVDRGDEVWLYRPASHKTAWRGHDRTIALGPRAQEILAPWLRPGEPEAPLFQPAEAEAAWRAAKIAERKARDGVGNHKRPAREPQRRPRSRYASASYRRAISRACEKAGVDRWTPHRLRHSYATRVRQKFGLDAARAALGHSSAEVTLDYAELDTKEASRVAQRLG